MNYFFILIDGYLFFKDYEERNKGWRKNRKKYGICTELRNVVQDGLFPRYQIICQDNVRRMS